MGETVEPIKHSMMGTEKLRVKMCRRCFTCGSLYYFCPHLDGAWNVISFEEAQQDAAKLLLADRFEKPMRALGKRQLLEVFGTAEMA